MAQLSLGVLAYPKEVHLDPGDEVEGVAAAKAQGEPAVEEKHRAAVGVGKEDDGCDEVKEEIRDIEDALADAHAAGHCLLLWS